MTRARANLVLLIGVLTLAVAAVVLVVVDDEPKAPAEAVRYAQIVDAATEEMTAFLTMDHARFDELSARVLQGATGSFKDEYSQALESLRKTATDEQWVATPTIDSVGIGVADEDSATVFVSAGTVETFESAGDDSKQRPWRIKLEMVNEDDRWLVSDVSYVG